MIIAPYLWAPHSFLFFIYLFIFFFFWRRMRRPCQGPTVHLSGFCCRSSVATIQPSDWVKLKQSKKSNLSSPTSPPTPRCSDLSGGQNQMAALPLRPPVHAAAHLWHYEVIRATKQGIKVPAIRRRQQSMRRPTPTISAATPAAAAGRMTDDAGSIRGKDERSTVGGEYKTTDEIRAALHQSLQGINRGIFGITSAKRSEIVRLVEMLESQNPTPQPTDNLLDTVDGCWKLVYSTVSILGAKRTKLGLRDFIALGDFFQIIDVEKEKATNVIKFNVRGLKMLNGQLTIEASFKIASKTRVDITLDNSSITPDQLMEVFRKNYDVLLAIFNPEGWLEISYVDDFMRIGRDDKGNIFVLERAELEKV